MDANGTLEQLIKSDRRIAKGRQHLLSALQQIQDPILGMCGRSGSLFIITPTRILDITPEGAVTAIKYNDVSSLQITGGQRTGFLFKSWDAYIATVNYRGGTTSHITVYQHSDEEHVLVTATMDALRQAYSGFQLSS